MCQCLNVMGDVASNLCMSLRLATFLQLGVGDGLHGAGDGAPPIRRALHSGAHFSSTSQLNLSYLGHKIHPKYPLIPHDTSSTPRTLPLCAPPIPQNAVKLSRKVSECKPLL
jgi:hypothetical protein